MSGVVYLLLCFMWLHVCRIYFLWGNKGFHLFIRSCSEMLFNLKYISFKTKSKNMLVGKQLCGLQA